MKQKLFGLVFLSILSISIFSCKKEIPVSLADEKVELYLIDSFSRFDNSPQIDESSVILEDLPLIYYSDFLSYDSENYIFKISDQAKDTINNLEAWAPAFAITVDKTLIYTGYFHPAISSTTCQWVCIWTPIISSKNKIPVYLGDPGSNYEGIPDNRNDERMIRVFRNDKRLK